MKLKKEPEWFVKTWNWNQEQEEYVPELIGYYTEAEAREAYDAVSIDDDTNGASLIDNTNGRWDTIDWKPL